MAEINSIDYTMTAATNTSVFVYEAPDPSVEGRQSIMCHYGMSGGNYYCANEATWVVRTQLPCGHPLFRDPERPTTQLYCTAHLKVYLTDLVVNGYICGYDYVDEDGDEAECQESYDAFEDGMILGIEPL